MLRCKLQKVLILNVGQGQWRLVNRGRLFIYITLEKLHKYNSAIPDNCVKCDKEKGTFFHCIWQCTKIQKFWQEINQGILNILQIQIPLVPYLIIFGLYPDNFNFKKHQQIFVDLSVLVAKRVIALSWKNTNSPSEKRLLSELCSTLPIEKNYVYNETSTTQFPPDLGSLYLLCMEDRLVSCDGGIC